jgi:predicted MFS family arabinose efflux permease
MATGSYYSLSPLTYMIFSFVVGRIIANNYSKPALMIFGTFIMVISNLLMGPSLFLNFNDNFWYTCIGRLLLGFSIPFMFIPSLP